MHAITGITGQVGAQLADLLLKEGEAIRAVVRDASKAREWAARGCEVALAAMGDRHALARAFEGAETVFVLLPSNFDPAPDSSENRVFTEALAAALQEAAPARVVCLSTIGAQATQENLLTRLQVLERALSRLPMPVAFLRAAWFMENARWDIEGARQQGVVSSFLQPADKPVPMVATVDVARLAAQLLRERWEGVRTVELEGPSRVTPLELAATLGRVLGREVENRTVPRAAWEALFRAQGMSNPGPRMRMLDGFNEGWIEFERPAAVRKGSTTLDTVLGRLAARTDA